MTPANASTSQEEFDHIYGWSEEFDCKIVDGCLAPTPLSYIPPPTEEEDEDEELFFKLYAFPNVMDEYILELHEVRTSRVERSHLIVEEKENCKVTAYDLEQGTYVVFPILNDPFTLQPPPNHKLLLQDRLKGWTIEKRMRANGKGEKFYYHGGRQFRSFVEVTTFILFTTKSKEDLKTVFRNLDPNVEAPITMSSD